MVIAALLYRCGWQMVTISILDQLLYLLRLLAHSQPSYHIVDIQIYSHTTKYCNTQVKSEYQRLHDFLTQRRPSYCKVSSHLELTIQYLFRRDAAKCACVRSLLQLHPPSESFLLVMQGTLSLTCWSANEPFPHGRGRSQLRKSCHSNHPHPFQRMKSNVIRLFLHSC